MSGGEPRGQEATATCIWSRVPRRAWAMKRPLESNATHGLVLRACGVAAFKAKHSVLQRFDLFAFLGTLADETMQSMEGARCVMDGPSAAADIVRDSRLVDEQQSFRMQVNDLEDRLATRTVAKEPGSTGDAPERANDSSENDVLQCT